MTWMETSRLLFAGQFVLAYILISSLVYFISDYTIYQPKQSSYQDDENVLKLTTENDKKISALYLENPKAEYTILFSHGNAEDLGNIFPILKMMRDFGYSILSYDYQGYGTSQGKPSEENTYRDIRAAYHFLVNDKKIDPSKIILFGRSLGSGPSVELATKETIGGLILEAPYLTAFRVITYIPLFPVDKYRNISKLKEVKVPLLIIHGTKDEVIPFWHGKRLFNAFKKKKESLWISNGKHNDLMSVALPEYKTAITSFTGGL